MPRLAKIIFLQSAGFEEFILPLQPTTLLHSTALQPAEFLFPAFHLLYNGRLPSNDHPLEHHYFPHEHAWIIFELQRGKQSFMAAFCRKKVVGAHFFSGAYEREMFWEDNKPKDPPLLLKLVKSLKWDYTPFIHSSHAYQKILWGKGSGNKEKKFTWGTTDQHILLTDLIRQFEHPTSFPAHLLLKAMAHFQSSDSNVINLKSIRDASQDFFKKWKDVRLFEEKAGLAKELVKQNSDLQHINEERRLLIRKCHQARKLLLEEQKELIYSQKENKKALNRFQFELQQTAEQEKSARLTHIKKLGYFEHLLLTAREKIEAYKAYPSTKKESKEQADFPRELYLKRDRWIEQEKSQLGNTFYEQQGAALLSWKEAYDNSFEEITQISSRLTQNRLDILALQAPSNTLPLSHSNTTSDWEQQLIGEATDELQIQHFQEILAQMEQQKEFELSLLQASKEKEELRLQQSLFPLEQRLQQLITWLENTSGTFYQWLDDRYPGWQKTIGKVIRDDVLFHPHLNPSVVRLNDLLYGIQISIGELSYSSPSLEELRLERNELLQEIEKHRDAFDAWNEENLKQQQSCEKRYRQRMKNIRTELKEVEIRSQQAELKRKKLKASDLVDAQIVFQENQQKLLKLQYQEAELEKELFAAQKRQNELEPTWTGIIEKARQAYQEQLGRLDEQFEKEEKAFAEQADKKDWDQYWLDQIVYIKKIPWIEAQIDLQNEIISNFEQDRNKRGEAQAKAFHQIEQSILQATERLAEIEKVLTTWNSLSVSIVEEDDVPEIPPSDKEDFGLLINRLQLLEGSYQAKSQQLSNGIHSFLHHFSPQNLFQFPQQIDDQEDQRSFVHQLKDLSSDKDIQRIKDQLAQEYAALITTIADQAKSLQNLKENLQEAVDLVNETLNDLCSAVLPLKIDLQESHDPLVLLLAKISELQDRAGQSLGGTSLFNPQPDQDVNQEALSLLSRLFDLLPQYPGKTFDLTNGLSIEKHILTDSHEMGQMNNAPYATPWQEQYINKCLVLAALRLFNKKESDVPLMLSDSRLDNLGPDIALAWIDWIKNHGFQLLASSKYGIGGGSFDAVWVSEEGEWIQMEGV